MGHAIRTPDGRTLAVEDYGDPAGRPVLVHMGTPNSRHLTLLQNRIPEVHAWLAGHL